MTDRATITVHEPDLDATKSVASVKVTQKEINSTLVTSGLQITDAFENKDNSLKITVINTGSAGKVIFKASDCYPNAMLGDLKVSCDASAITEIIIYDISRFENKDKTLNIDFTTGFTGTIYATAKHAGIRKLPTP